MFRYLAAPVASSNPPASEVDDIGEDPQIDQVWQNVNLCVAQLALLAISSDKLCNEAEGIILTDILQMYTQSR